MSVNDTEPVGKKIIQVKYTEWGEYRYYATFCMSFGYRGKRVFEADDPGIEVMRIWLDGELVFDRAANKRQANIRWYFAPGHEDQDPVAPGLLAYRGQILLWFTGFPLGTNPSGIPTISAEFHDTADFSVGEAMETFASRAGFADANIVTIGLDTPLVTGYLLDGQSSLESVAADMGFIYNFSMVEVAGVVTFANKYTAGALVIDKTVAEAKLAVIRETGDGQQIDVLERNSEQSLPASMTVTYYDFDAQYEAGSQEVSRFSGAVTTHSSEIDISVSLPVVATAEEMRNLAYDALYRAWQDRNGHALRLPTEFLMLDPGDTLQWTAYGGTYGGQAVKITINADFSLTLSIIEKAASYTAIGVNAQPPINPDAIVEPVPVQTAIFDVPDTEADQELDGYLNLRVGIGHTDGALDFYGARFDMTRQDQLSGWLPRYTTEDPVNLAVLGTTPAPNATGVRIETTAISADDLIDGADHTRMMVMGSAGHCEIFTYGFVILLEPGVYGLLDLSRGLFGTDDFINSHIAGDYVAFYDDLTIVPIPVQEFKSQVVYLHRTVAAFQDITEVDTLLYVPSGNSRKPYSPDNVTATRQLNGDIIITWSQDPRFSGEPEDQIETYSLDVYNGDWTQILRRVISIVQVIEYEYFIEEQEIDQTSFNTELNLLVFQKNLTHVGRGFPGGGTIPIVDAFLSVDMQATARIDAAFDHLEVNMQATGHLNASFDGPLAITLYAPAAIVTAI